MDRFIDYRIYIMLLGVLYLKSNMDRFIDKECLQANII